MVGRSRHRLRWALVGLMVFALATVGSAGALVLHGRTSIAQSEIGGITERVGEAVVLPDGESVQLINVLLVGTDDRSTLSEAQFAQLGVDRAPGRRADTLMLAQLEVGGEGAALLSFPRDLRVELCDGTTDKINAALAAGTRSGAGPESCLVQTVADLTGVDIHHYVEVDFRGFMEVVEVLGGVTMHLDEPMVDVKASLNVPAGCVTLTPDQALGFVRSRGYDDDFGRIARQQRFIREVVEELTRVGVLANPPKLFALVDRAASAVRTDDGLGLAAMRDIGMGLRRVSASGLQGLTVPGHGTAVGDVSYIELDAEAAAPLFAAFRDGTAIRPGEHQVVEESPVEVPPVVVRNATEIQGLGAAAAELLVAHGLEVADVGNADDLGTAVTEIVHAPELAAAAGRLAEILPGAVVREDAAAQGVSVVLGADRDIAGLGEQQAALAQPQPDAPDVEPDPAPSFRGAATAPDVDC